MTAVVLTSSTVALAYVLDAVLVGALLAALRLRSGAAASGRRLFLGLLLTFAALDLYWVPAVLALDVTVKIGDPDAIAVFGAGFSGRDLMRLGWFEIVVWVGQGLVAVAVAGRLARPVERQSAPM